MKVINLTYPEKSDIKFKISKFPDGQQNISIDKETIKWIIQGEILLDVIRTVHIKSRLNSFLDLELITCAVASLRELGVEEIHLYTPYIMGARSDRKFEEGGNNYLRDVLCPVINSLNFKTVTCIDPHSDVLEACIKGFKKLSNLDLVKFVINDLYLKNKPTTYKLYLFTGEVLGDSKNCILVSPDAGASKKIYKLAEQIGYKGDVITCSKDRDKEGKLTKFKIDLSSVQDDNKDYIIIDDICDGGATFINIASMLKGATTGKIYLIVTHGIFSKGFEELSKYFDGIYCANSYSDIKVEGYQHKEEKGSSLVKQLNVF